MPTKESASVLHAGGERRATRAWFREQQMHIAERTLEEPPFAVAKVELPQPNEAVRHAEPAHGREVREETLAPCTQRRRVVRADVFEVRDLHVRRLAQRIRDGGDRGNEAARENEALDVVD